MSVAGFDQKCLPRLAVTNSGRLATFDRRIPTKAVAGSQNALELIHA
jgi:hypothetical protein